MPNIKIVRLLIVLALCVMMAAAVKVRSEAILQTKYKSIDEMVYHRLAVQIQWGLENYHTIPLAHKLSDAGRDLPDYFFEPLFKHPPLFTFFNYAVYQTFGITPLSPFYVTLACGVLMIPLVYLFGAYVFNLWVGFSALVMALDPVTIICSQKVWPDSMIGLWVTLALFAFTWSLARNNNRGFVFSGFVSGLGALTKYTGALGTIICFVYAAVYDRKLFRNPYFWACLLIPLIMLIPWFAWNVHVYGWKFFAMQIQLHSNSEHFAKVKHKLLVLVLAAATALVFFFKYVRKFSVKSGARTNIRIAAGCAAVLLLWEYIVRSFNLFHLPRVSWAGAAFYGSPPYFYLARLLEWNLVSFFAMLAFFIPKKSAAPGSCSCAWASSP